ncbi:MAG: hypothetical protein WCT03_15610, partial [Candidatus Obscuribacterales bacterium]
AALGVILTAGYMLWLLKKVFYGEELPKWKGHLSDATNTEKIVAYSLSFSILALGIYPLMLIQYYAPVSDKMSDDIRGHISVTQNLEIEKLKKKTAISLR